jgi:hypothetical protein
MAGVGDTLGHVLLQGTDLGQMLPSVCLVTAAATTPLRFLIDRSSAAAAAAAADAETYLTQRRGHVMVTSGGGSHQRVALRGYALALEQLLTRAPDMRVDATLGPSLAHGDGDGQRWTYTTLVGEYAVVTIMWLRLELVQYNDLRAARRLAWQLATRPARLTGGGGDAIVVHARLEEANVVAAPSFWTTLHRLICVLQRPLPSDLSVGGTLAISEHLRRVSATLQAVPSVAQGVADASARLLRRALVDGAQQEALTWRTAAAAAAADDGRVVHTCDLAWAVTQLKDARDADRLRYETLVITAFEEHGVNADAVPRPVSMRALLEREMRAISATERAALDAYFAGQDDSGAAAAADDDDGHPSWCATVPPAVAPVASPPPPPPVAWPATTTVSAWWTRVTTALTPPTSPQLPATTTVVRTLTFMEWHDAASKGLLPAKTIIEDGVEQHLPPASTWLTDWLPVAFRTKNPQVAATWLRLYTPAEWARLGLTRSILQRLGVEQARHVRGWKTLDDIPNTPL